MNIRKHIPNALTCGNLLCGCWGIAQAYQHSLKVAAVMVVSGAIFDFFDGLVARWLNASSPIGKELDSLADMVTFGVLPGAIVYECLSGHSLPQGLALVAFLVPLCAALRLAKFNIDPRQTTSFIGLPSPANALLLASFAWMETTSFWYSPAMMLLLSVASALLMVSEIPLVAFKFKNFSLKKHPILILFLVVSLLLLVFFRAEAMPIVIALYIIVSFFLNRLNKQ